MILDLPKNKKCMLVNTANYIYSPNGAKERVPCTIIVSHVLNNPEWLVSLQTHKYLNIP